MPSCEESLVLLDGENNQRLSSKHYSTLPVSLTPVVREEMA